MGTSSSVRYYPQPPAHNGASRFTHGDHPPDGGGARGPGDITPEWRVSGAAERHSQAPGHEPGLQQRPQQQGSNQQHQHQHQELPGGDAATASAAYLRGQLLNTGQLLWNAAPTVLQRMEWLEAENNRLQAENEHFRAAAAVAGPVGGNGGPGSSPVPTQQQQKRMGSPGSPGKLHNESDSESTDNDDDGDFAFATEDGGGMSSASGQGKKKTVALRVDGPSLTPADVLRRCDDAICRVKARPGHLFEDPAFQHRAESLVEDMAEVLHEDRPKVEEWKSTSRWKPAHTFVPDFHRATTWQNADPYDVDQGSLGDCYFLSALATLAEKRHKLRYIRSAFLRDSLETGVFAVQLCVGGEMVAVGLDSFFPCHRRTGAPLFSRAVDESALWVQLLEKAWAKVNGSFYRIEGGSAAEAMHVLTGAPSQVLVFSSLRQAKVKNFGSAPAVRDGAAALRKAHGGGGDGSTDVDSYIFAKIQRGLARGHPMCASGAQGTKEEAEARGLVTGHAYAVLDAAQVDPGQDGWDGAAALRLVRLRNPWGSFEWKGAWSENSSDWKRYPRLFENLEADDQKLGKDTGTFWMALDDFTRHFNRLQVNFATPDGKYWHHNTTLSPGVRLEGIVGRGVENIACVRVTVTHADDINFSVAIAGQSRTLLRQTEKGSGKRARYKTSIGFVVVDEKVGGGTAVASTRMEDDADAEVEVTCARRGGSSYLVFVSTSPRTEVPGQELRVVLGAYVHHEHAKVHFEEVLLSAEEWSDKQVAAFEAAARQDFGMNSWSAAEAGGGSRVQLRTGWGWAEAGNDSTRGVDLLEFKNVAADGNAVRLEATLELANMSLMADDDGKLEVAVPKAAQAAARGSAADPAADSTTTYEVTTVIPPGQTACLVTRMLRDGRYSRQLSYSAVMVPKQRTDAELAAVVRRDGQAKPYKTGGKLVAGATLYSHKVDGVSTWVFENKSKRQLTHEFDFSLGNLAVKGLPAEHTSGPDSNGVSVFKVAARLAPGDTEVMQLVRLDPTKGSQWGYKSRYWFK